MSRISAALIVVDVQKDFCPGGALAVPGGDRVVPELNRWITFFSGKGLPVTYTQDWHPPNHCSFRENEASGPSIAFRGLKVRSFTTPFWCKGWFSGRASRQDERLTRVSKVLWKASRAALPWENG